MSWLRQCVAESYTIAQWLALLPGKQKVPGSNPGGAACFFFHLGLQSEFSETERKSETHGLRSLKNLKSSQSQCLASAERWRPTLEA